MRPDHCQRVSELNKREKMAEQLNSIMAGKTVNAVYNVGYGIGISFEDGTEVIVDSTERGFSVSANLKKEFNF